MSLQSLEPHWRWSVSLQTDFKMEYLTLVQESTAPSPPSMMQPTTSPGPTKKQIKLYKTYKTVLLLLLS